jgi:hypothetical protein
MRDEITFGPVTLPLALLATTHQLWAGRSGMGKSRGLLYLIRAILGMVARRAWSLIVLDGKGGSELDSLADQAYREALRVVPRARIAYVNPHDPGARFPGLNLLELVGAQSAEACAEQLLYDIQQIFPTDEGLFHPWIMQYGRMALEPLIRSRLTVAELDAFLSVADPRFRLKVLEDLADVRLTRAWQELAVLKPFEQLNVLRAISARARELVANPTTLAMVGQQHTGLDFVGLMDTGGVSILKLGASPVFSEVASQFVGRSALRKVIAAAPARRQRNVRPCVVVCDEAEQFAGATARCYDLLRGYSVSLVLAFQRLGQLRRESPDALDAALENARVKFAFNVGRASAEVLIGEFFTDFGRDAVIENIHHPVFAPREVWRVARGASVTDIRNRTWNVTDSTLASWARTAGDAEGWMEADVCGSTDFSGSGRAVVTDPDGNLSIIDTASSGTGSNAASISGRSGSHIELETIGGARGRARGRGGSTGRALAASAQLVPGVAYHREEILAARRAWSVVQLREQAIAGFMNQPQRGCTAKFFEDPPVAFAFPDVQAPAVPPTLLQRCHDANYARWKAIPEVIAAVTARVPRYLEDRTSNQQTDGSGFKNKTLRR